MTISTENQRTRRRIDNILETLQNASVEITVASLHWGPNMVEHPPEQFQQFARWLIDNGVDIVHGHSAHIFQGIECYKDRLILYDTGDFVDDYAVDPQLRNDRSFLYEVAIDSDGCLEKLSLRPTQIENCSVQQADGNVAQWARHRMERLSTPFNTDFEVEGNLLVKFIKN